MQKSTLELVMIQIGMSVLIWSVLVSPYNIDSFGYGIILLPLLGGVLIYIINFYAALMLHQGNYGMVMFAVRVNYVVGIIMGLSQATLLHFSFLYGAIMGIVYVALLQYGMLLIYKLERDA